MVLQYTLLDSFWQFKEKWFRNDQEMTKKWPRNDWEMTEKWLRNDWEMTEKWPKNGQKMTEFEWEILFMTINDWYHPFSSAIHKQSLNEIV